MNSIFVCPNHLLLMPLSLRLHMDLKSLQKTSVDWDFQLHIEPTTKITPVNKMSSPNQYPPQYLAQTALGSEYILIQIYIS